MGEPPIRTGLGVPDPTLRICGPLVTRPSTCSAMRELFTTLLIRRRALEILSRGPTAMLAHAIRLSKGGGGLCIHQGPFTSACLSAPFAAPPMSYSNLYGSLGTSSMRIVTGTLTLVPHISSNALYEQ